MSAITESSDSCNDSAAKIIIRPGTPEDAAEVVQLYEWELLRHATLKRITDLLNNFPSAIATNNGQIIGFCYSEETAPGVLELLNLLVKGEYQSLGVGTKLVKETLRQARENSEAVMLFNSSGYPKMRSPFRFAEGFYRRLGFVEKFRTTQTVCYAITF